MNLINSRSTPFCWGADKETALIQYEQRHDSNIMRGEGHGGGIPNELKELGKVFQKR